MTSLIPNGGLVCEPYLYRKKVLKLTFLNLALQIFLIYLLNAGGAFADFFGRRQLYAKSKTAQNMDREEEQLKSKGEEFPFSNSNAPIDNSGCEDVDAEIFEETNDEDGKKVALSSRKDLDEYIFRRRQMKLFTLLGVIWGFIQIVCGIICTFILPI